MKYSPEELNKVLEAAPKNDKGQPVISDEDFMDNLNDLPAGTRTEDGKIASKNGYLHPPQKGTERAKEIAAMGGVAHGEMYRERKKWAETIDIYLKKTDANGVSNQDKIVMGMIAKAMDGCVGASEFLRDTVGEKPTDNLNLEVMTDADRELLENLKARINERITGSKE